LAGFIFNVRITVCYNKLAVFKNFKELKTSRQTKDSFKFSQIDL